MTDLERKAVQRVFELLEIAQGDLRDATEILRQALTQPEQDKHDEKEMKSATSAQESIAMFTEVAYWYQEFLNKNSTKEQPEQTPVAWIEKDALPLTHIIKAVVRREKDEQYVVPLYTAPPKREWQGLTDEEKSFLKETWLGFKDIDKVIDTVDELLRRRTYD